jgi:hypothetical protein
MTPRTQFEDVFLKRSSSLYDSMAQRKQAKLAGGLPFSRAEWSCWLLEQLGGTMEGVIKCHYCNLHLHVGLVTPDHKTALSRGGSLGLENLALACAKCNRVKGSCSEDGFRMLIDFLLTLHPSDMSDVLGRLATGGEGAKALWRRQSKAKPF